MGYGIVCLSPVLTRWGEVISRFLWKGKREKIKSCYSSCFHPISLPLTSLPFVFSLSFLFHSPSFPPSSSSSPFFSPSFCHYLSFVILYSSFIPSFPICFFSPFSFPLFSLLILAVPPFTTHHLYFFTLST